MNYKFIADLNVEANIPKKGILSNVLHKDETLNVIMFSFSAGQELSAHSAPTPALLHFLGGEADVHLGDDVVHATTGSLVVMPPMLPHAIRANKSTTMLLVQIKSCLPKS